MTNAVIGMMALLGFMYLVEISLTRPELGLPLTIFVGIMYFAVIIDITRKARK